MARRPTRHRPEAGLTAPRRASVLLTALAAMTLAACDDDDDPATPSGPTTFEVTLENVNPLYAAVASGVFNTPVGAAEPGPAGSGMAYEATFPAGIGHRLHFATMFVQSNDLFYAPDEEGIALWDESGNPVMGDVTDQVQLWDAGTEVDQEPGVGADQAPRQGGADTGDDDPDDTVRLAEDASGNIDPVDEVIEVTLSYDGDQMFTLRIENVSSDMSTSAGNVPVLIAPGVFAVSGASAVLFAEGSPDPGDGLEALAEDGDASILGGALDAETGVTTPLAPGVWVVHTSTAPLFTSGSPDAGDGLEGLAEDADPTALSAAVMGAAGIQSSGVFNTPDGASGPGPITPGDTFSFTIMAEPGDMLSFATMFGQSNDLFYAPDENGIALFSGDTPTSGDVSSQVDLWDAGTEVNQAPGIGNDQAPRQAGPDTGDDEAGNVRLVDDGFVYPAPVLRVTITPMS